MTAVPRPNSEPPIRRYLEQSHAGPTALRIMLGAQLRRLRQERGVSRKAAGDVIRASHAKISRMELGQVGFKERDLADLLTHYGLTNEEERSQYFELARRANTPGWWHEYSDVVEDWFELHLGLEQAASVIRTYEVQFLPGLLQTEDYAHAVTLLGYPNASTRKRDRLVELRMARQRLLTKPGAPRFWTVVDEATLRRPFGGPKVMRAQLEHLLQALELPNVSLQVAPFSIGAHAAAGSPITTLRFQEPDLPDIVYLEQLTGAVYLDKQDHIDQYSLIMDRLCAEAQPPRETAAFLKTLLDETV